MNPLATKLILGTIATVAVGGPGTYLAIENLKDRPVQEQLDRDGLKIFENTESTKWKEKIGNGENEDLKNFVKDHSDTSESSVSETALEKACQACLKKNTSEINYEKFKQYCTEKKQ